MINCGCELCLDDHMEVEMDVKEPPQYAGHKDDGKVQLHYILGMEGLDQVAKVGEFGATKYGQYNFKTGMPWMKLAGSLSRHLAAFIRGEDLDRESGLPHLAHLCYDALMLLDYRIHHRELDDRFYKETATR